MSVAHNLSSAPLVRLLQDLVPAAGDAPSADVAERLSQWLGAFDTVKLDGALQTIESYPAQARTLGQPVDVQTLSAWVQTVQSDVNALIAPPSAATRPPPARGPLGDRSVLPDVAPAVEPSDVEALGHLVQRHQELQKQIETRVTACRARVRQALARGTPRLRRLAALDAVMEQMFGVREQRLLGSVPVLLERRLEQRQHDHAPAAVLFQDLRDALMAELNLRLQPVLGLIEAARQESLVSPSTPTPA